MASLLPASFLPPPSLRRFVAPSLLLLSLSSCAPPMMLAGPTIQAISAGAGAYVNGEIQAAWTVPVDQLWPAAQTTVRTLEFKVKSEKLIPGKRGTLFVVDDSKRSIEISMVAITPSVTRFTIRVGLFGDEAISRLIVKALEVEAGKVLATTPDHAIQREP